MSNSEWNWCCQSNPNLTKLVCFCDKTWQLTILFVELQCRRSSRDRKNACHDGRRNRIRKLHLRKWGGSLPVYRTHDDSHFHSPGNKWTFVLQIFFTVFVQVSAFSNDNVPFKAKVDFSIHWMIGPALLY
jgi:hypothetical protein